MNTNSIVLIALAYFIGSIPFAILTSRFFHLKDPRSYGSKNPGATNVMRSGHRTAALLTLLGDALKGWLVVFFALRYMSEWGITSYTVAAIALVVVLGHIFPIFLKFQGGKGVATAIGVIFALSPQIALIMCILWIILVLATKVSALGALVVCMLCPFLSLYFIDQPAYQFVLSLISIIVLVRHRENITQILNSRRAKR
ncbi:MAG: glycerol-3-phosphate 1-O-acyltransferase PlsY [Neisseriaceae bacterium]